jgi:hypothetical protein
VSDPTVEELFSPLQDRERRAATLEALEDRTRTFTAAGLVRMEALLRHHSFAPGARVMRPEVRAGGRRIARTAVAVPGALDAAGAVSWNLEQSCARAGLAVPRFQAHRPVVIAEALAAALLAWDRIPEATRVVVCRPWLVFLAEPQRPDPDDPDLPLRVALLERTRPVDPILAGGAARIDGRPGWVLMTLSRLLLAEPGAPVREVAHRDLVAVHRRGTATCWELALSSGAVDLCLEGGPAPLRYVLVAADAHGARVVDRST